MTGHVFISYASEDRAFADQVATFFQSENVPVWLDSAVGSGSAFEELSGTRIGDCAAFVVVLTPASVASKWVVGEVLQAIEAGKFIVPLLRLPCDLPVPLKAYQSVDVTSGDMPGVQCLNILRELVGTRAPGGRHARAGTDDPAAADDRPGTVSSAGADSPVVAGIPPAVEVPVQRSGPPASDASEPPRLSEPPGPSGPSGPSGPHTSVVAQAVAAARETRDASAATKGPSAGRTRPTKPPFTETWPPVVTNATQRAALTGHERPVYAVAVSRDGRWLASASEDCTVRIWDLGGWGHASELCTAVLTGHTERITTVAFAPDGSWLATGADDGRVRIWDRDTGGCHATLLTGPVQGLAITADGTLVTVSGANLSTWDLAERNVRASLDSPFESARRITALAVAPDGTWLVVGDDRGGLRVWDLTTNRPQPTITVATKEITAIVIADNGARVAAASDDGTVRLWHQSTRDLGATFAGYTANKVYWTPLVGANDPRFGLSGRDTVWAVAIAPDATWLATAESDRITRIWETSTGDIRAVLRGRGPVLGRKAGTLAVAIAPDGKWLATGDSDGIVRVWDVGRARA